MNLQGLIRAPHLTACPSDVFFRSGVIGCGFVNGCGLVTWNTLTDDRVQ